MKYWCDMHKIHYRLNKDLNPNKILQDIQKMINNHQKLNKLEDTVLSIEIKDIVFTQNDDIRNVTDDKKDGV